jgi:hypothetical protein
MELLCLLADLMVAGDGYSITCKKFNGVLASEDLLAGFYANLLLFLRRSRADLYAFRKTMLTFSYPYTEALRFFSFVCAGIILFSYRCAKAMLLSFPCTVAV